MKRSWRWPLLSALLLLLLVRWVRAGQGTLPPAPAGSFSIVVLPDTQAYRGKGTKAEPNSEAAVTNLVFDTYTKWIGDNLQRQRIVFVSHVGDIVDKNVPEQWEVARRCMDRLHGRVPYGISVGNHDMASNGDSSLFQRYFPESRFKSFAWYGGCFRSEADDQSVSGNNANSFQLFSAEGLDFVFLHLECNAPDNVLAWADDVLKRYSDRRALVTTHMGLGPRDKPQTSQDFFDAPKGRMRWKKRHGERGNTPEQMWQKCFSKHRNLFIIFCGDQSRTQAMHQTTPGEHGNPIHEVLSDYGAAGLRVYRFVPKENLIRVHTHSPLEESLCLGTRIVPDPAQHQFTLRYDMSEKTILGDRDGAFYFFRGLEGHSQRARRQLFMLSL
jgi:hypothetical protein